MGTSVSQPSPKTSNWRPVFACYANTNIREDRVIGEIWRASENETVPISEQMKSDAIFQCFQAVSSSTNFQEAIQKFNQAVASSKQNSIVAEFAKRVIPLSFQSDNPSVQWQQNIFAELTRYVVSRDASGFVGKGSRNETVGELISFKQHLAKRVSEIVGGTSPIVSKDDWSQFIDSSISKLKSIK